MSYHIFPALYNPPYKKYNRYTVYFFPPPTYPNGYRREPPIIVDEEKGETLCQ
jgi:hypothetical protein